MKMEFSDRNQVLMICLFAVTIFVLLFLKCDFSSNKLTHIPPKVGYQSILTVPKPQSLKNESQSVYLCVVFRGRLGNMMSELASSYAIARSNNMKVMIKKNSYISNIFKLPNVTIAQSNSFCDRLPMRPEKASSIAVFDPKLLKFNERKSYRSNDYLHSWRFFDGYKEEIRQQFVFKDAISRKANVTISSILQEHSIKSRDQVVLIGVHIRRGDIVKTGKKSGFNLASDEYLGKGVKYFTEKYATKRLVFVIISDDMNYAKKYFPTHVNSTFVHNCVECDMATIASCDHALMTIGSFGWWCSWLTNGDVVYYNKPYVKGSKWDIQENYDNRYYKYWKGLS